MNQLPDILHMNPFFPDTIGQSPAESPFIARLKAELSLQKPQFLGYSWQQQRQWRMAA
jgi:hypothetical protein